MKVCLDDTCTMHYHQHTLQRIHMCQVNRKGKGKATIDCGCAREDE